MAQQPSVETPVPPEIPLSDSASAHAPFLYFEEVSAFGHMNGIIRVTLEASRLYAAKPGVLVTDRVMVAHLRMNIPAAIALKNAIDGALLLANPAPTETKN